MGTLEIETDETPQRRAAATEAQMTDDERVQLTHGLMVLPGLGSVDLPADAPYGAGYVAGVPRLDIPALTETDASLGVGYLNNLRGDGGATALPSGMAMGSTWNPALMRTGGAAIGAEARAKGFNVLLAGGANLVRDPRNGRTFEYLGEDPLHTGLLAGAAIAGIQSNHIISTIKHFALNGQETGRHFLSANISDANARESDLLAFQIAIERGRPGAVMSAYNKVNGEYASGSDYLLNHVLKRDWGFKGFVMSDWGAVHHVDFALKGLDQQSGEQLDAKIFFSEDLKQAAAEDHAYAERLGDMNRRILYAIYANELDKHPVAKGGEIDRDANAQVAEAIAKEGIVLLRNRDGALPLPISIRRIAVIGGFADKGVLSGGGSTQVHGAGGPAATIPWGAGGPFAEFICEQYQRSTPPLRAIKAMAPGAEVTFRSGFYLGEAVQAARKAEVAIVFANQWQSEGFDQPDLSLPRGQDALIDAVASANPATIVVLQTGSAIEMPWLEKTAAVIEAWYPGARGGEAIASVLFGETNPSGRLPITFPAALAQLPRPDLDGADVLEPDFLGKGKPGQVLNVDYDIEGSDVGYRWNARREQAALFPFGHGLSYTSFARSELQMSGIEASCTITNTGMRRGAAVAQLYLVEAAGERRLRLAAFEKVDLAPGASQLIRLTAEPRVLADWDGRGWSIRPGRYGFALGDSAEDLGPVAYVELTGRTW